MLPFRDLTDDERRIVFEGPAEKRHILYKAKNGDDFAELDFTYYNAVYTVENALSKAKDEKGLARVARFLKEGVCAACGGTRLSENARRPRIAGVDLAQATSLSLDDALAWIASAPDALPAEMRPMARSICASFVDAARRLEELGLGYLALDRAGSTLSTGERQRVQLARSVRNQTTGVLYVLDEPSIGLHPANVEGLLGVMRDLVADGNTVVVVDHDTRVLSSCDHYVLDEPSIGLHPANVEGLLGVMRDLVADGNTVVVVDHDTRVLSSCDHLVEMGPVAGVDGGYVVAQGSVEEVSCCEKSLIAPFLKGVADSAVRDRTPAARMFDGGSIHVETDAVYTVKPLTLDIPQGRLVAVTGVSGSGKTTLVLETIVAALQARAAADAVYTVKPLTLDIPQGRLVAVTGVSGSGKTTLVLETIVAALQARAAGAAPPAHVRMIDAGGVGQVKLIDATPIGANVRSTVSTYAGVHDELRRAYARTAQARSAGLKAGDFSYNTGKLRCPACEGTGSISLDVQFLPDVEVTCPDCHGSRYAPEASAVHWADALGGALTLPQVMSFSVDEALDALSGLKKAHRRLQTLHDLGLGYLTLGEPTPALSGGEAQRLKLAEALDALSGLKKAHRRLQTLHDLGLGYLTLGEPTPALSGGEAQRLKLASEMGKTQAGAVFVFDEPTIGLHPLDVRVLLSVFDRLVDAEAQRLKLASEMGKTQAGAVFVFDEPTIGLHPLDVRVLLSVFDRLVDAGATVLVVEHDLDVIRNADYVIDMGPGGGEAGGEVVFAGTPEELATCAKSVTGRYLR